MTDTLLRSDRGAGGTLEMEPSVSSSAWVMSCDHKQEAFCQAVNHAAATPPRRHAEVLLLF
ncbi:hypothetical protein EYF80_042650 [Liparis tanakae]|uniref:Uncharacterized protein n=1 Tax=Liparis tanakae TaxID=230148 RepID=A0A4Z2G0R4_9TELE|nr:hypothetical protein EYF80_042650 [Liparis tanakae]